MVRILQLDTHNPVTYENNVTVRAIWDGPRQLMYLRIKYNEKVDFYRGLS
jgi:hypothetical protein